MWQDNLGHPSKTTLKTIQFHQICQLQNLDFFLTNKVAFFQKHKAYQSTFILLNITCGLMFPRYKLVVLGSPTSCEPGA